MSLGTLLLRTSVISRAVTSQAFRSYKPRFRLAKATDAQQIAHCCILLHDSFGDVETLVPTLVYQRVQLLLNERCKCTTPYIFSYVKFSLDYKRYHEKFIVLAWTVKPTQDWLAIAEDDTTFHATWALSTSEWLFALNRFDCICRLHNHPVLTLALTN